MNFKIEMVQNDGLWVPFSDVRASHSIDNLFTLIVGQNAVGKSRLLRKVVSEYIFGPDINHQLFNYEDEVDRLVRYTTPEDYHSRGPIIQRDIFYGELHTDFARYYESRQEIKCWPGSMLWPSSVIAVSTGRHDRFPAINLSKKNISPIQYSYIGASGGAGLNLSGSLVSLLEGLVEGRQKLSHLAGIFEYLGFEPYLDIRLTLDKRNVSKFYKNREELHSVGIDPIILDFILQPEDRKTRPPLIAGHILEDLKYHSKTNIEVGFRDSDLGWQYDAILNLIPLVKSEIVKISDVGLISSRGKSRLRLSHASSGQQCMLTIMLGIAGSIKNGSLICIDEPEISLHPSWQTNVVSQLQNVFSGYTGCHFLIATHSPQIVSGLTTENGYVLSLEDKKLYYSNEYAKRSADYQLAEIFNSPGFNNEYLVRISLLMLTKLSRREGLSHEDKNSLLQLFKIRAMLSESDPVYHLIGQIEAII